MKNKNTHNYTIETLPLGSVIEYRKKRYYKSAGMDGDIMTYENAGGMWKFVNHPKYFNCLSWKTFKVLFVPEQKKK